LKLDTEHPKKIAGAREKRKCQLEERDPINAKDSWQAEAQTAREQLDSVAEQLCAVIGRGRECAGAYDSELRIYEYALPV